VRAPAFANRKLPVHGSGRLPMLAYRATSIVGTGVRTHAIDIPNAHNSWQVMAPEPGDT